MHWSGNGLLGAASVSLLAGAAAAGQRLEDVPDLRSTAFLSGRCERLVIAGEDVSHVCRGPLYNATYRSGRISFLFPGGEAETNTGLMVSFSGTEQRREGDRTQLLLDRITLAGSEDEGAATEAAEGICEYGDSSSGPMRVSCAGRTGTGDFIGIFASDGKAPTVQESDGRR
jgi:hypothetical protein